MIVAGFVSVVAWSLRERFLPARSVTVVPVVLTQADVRQAGTPLFQAAGWVEPRPSAVVVSALVEGVIEELLVAEGQPVVKGQPIAKLIDADARLTVADAEASVRLREAELALAQGTLEAAKIQFEQPVQMQAALAEAEATLAKLQTEIKNLPFAIRTAQSQLLLAEQSLAGKKSVGDSITVRALQQAQSEFDTATAARAQLVERGSSLQNELSAWGRKCDALRSQLTLKTEETRKLSESRANVQAGEAKLQQAKVAVEIAQLRLSRMTVHAPITGRVLTVVAKPGRRLMGLAAASEQDSATIVTLYDPKMLQVRADVRLEDVSQVQPGFQAQITSAALRAPLLGEVIVATSQADIQKNTLQVKVAIHDPPAVIKPEMLVQVSFIAPERKSEQHPGSVDPLRILVPRTLVETTEGGTTLWIADLTRGVARRQAIRLGAMVNQELVEVVGGLTPLDKLIVSGRDGIQEGARIRVTDEDRTLGIASH
ncbi:MAG: efflux RND transporter periplasmic adaptor subunit [Planctomycetaceae bacterium]|nr:efflux RND transporter periplasmic adaptor subunit [Planctomycetaceae bacterium]